MRNLIAALCLLAVTNTWAAIGAVSEHKGTGCEITRGKSKLPGHKGAEIESMDIYTTTNCSTSITFKDDTKVKITENSRLLIDDFVFDPKQSDAGKLALKVGAGTVRYASGQIAKNNPQQVAIKTPTATIAVRGTDFNMTVDETGQSLVVLVPSCKDPSEQKRYELDEQRCKVGKIDVMTLVGKVTLEEAFSATFVASASVPPTPPTIINMIEANLNNSLIISKPPEVAKAVRESNKTDREKDSDRLEDEVVRRSTLNSQVLFDSEANRLLLMKSAAAAAGCNSTTSVCIAWDKPESERPQAGRGIAFRNLEGEHYAEVKTQGYISNTSITIVHNDNVATELIGDGTPGGNVIYIKQNSGVLRPNTR